MPQVFQVLRCYKCFIFQIHLTKKSSKWECKLCGEKQSVKRHYGIGTSKDCRMHVQKLNKMQREKYNSLSNNISSLEAEDEDTVKGDAPSYIQSQTKSRWSDFIEASDTTEKSAFCHNNKTVKNSKSSQLESELKKHINFKETEYIIEPLITVTKNIKSEDFTNSDADTPQDDIKFDHSLSTKEIFFDKINASSKWTNFVDKIEENCLQSSDKFKLKIGDYKMKPSKSSNLQDNICNNTKHDSNRQNSNILKKFTSVTKESKLTSNIETNSSIEVFGICQSLQPTFDSNSQGYNGNSRYSLFSLSDDRDLDSILNV